jgi:DNA invertase Pin-like site-specific DNA recombinase
MEKTKRAALYVRVSTDKQTIENQIQALTRDAEYRDWKIVATYQDVGISGAKGSEDRPGLDQMLKDARQRKFDVVMVWAIDRMGRSVLDLLKTIKRLEECKVDVFIEKPNIDTTTPEGELMFTIVGAFSAFERKMIVSRVRAGLERAKKEGKTLGRPTKRTPAMTAKIKAALSTGQEGIMKIAKQYGVGTGTVQKIRAEMAN